MTTPNYGKVPDGYDEVFCRYRWDPRLKRYLDAHHYGLKAWRLLIKHKKPKD